jgi:PEP-CTERM motif
MRCTSLLSLAAATILLAPTLTARADTVDVFTLKISTMPFNGTTWSAPSTISFSIPVGQPPLTWDDAGETFFISPVVDNGVSSGGYNPSDPTAEEVFTPRGLLLGFTLPTPTPQPEYDFLEYDLFTGPPSAPIFTLGTYLLNPNFNGYFYPNNVHDAGLVEGELTISQVSSSPSPVPEPSSLTLLSIGLLGAAEAARRRLNRT